MLFYTLSLYLFETTGKIKNATYPNIAMEPIYMACVSMVKFQWQAKKYQFLKFSFILNMFILFSVASVVGTN